jgi:hypothetical protein
MDRGVVGLECMGFLEDDDSRVRRGQKPQDERYLSYMAWKEGAST